MTHVTVVGAGAIGGFVAARLLDAGVDVALVEANEEHVATMRADGLRVRGAASLHVRPRVLLPDEVEGPLGTVLLAVKARHTADALEAIAPNLADGGCVVSLQNGLEEYRIADARRRRTNRRRQHSRSAATTSGRARSSTAAPVRCTSASSTARAPTASPLSPPCSTMSTRPR